MLSARSCSAPNLSVLGPSEESARLIEDGAPKAKGAAPLRLSLLQAAKVLVACGLYLSIGPSLILVNRTLLKERKFNYPMALSGLGLLFSSAVSFLLVHLRCVPREHRHQITTSFFMRNLLPIGAALAATLATGNAVYLYLPVGFIQMLKAFTWVEASALHCHT